MNINPLTLNQIISKSTLQMDNRKYLVSLSIARALGYNLPIPTSAVEAPSKYFNDVNKITIEDCLAKINEVSVINIQETYELTYKIWMMRYSLVYNTKALDVVKFLDCEMTDENFFIPKIYIETIKTVGEENAFSFMNELNMSLSCNGEENGGE